MDIIETRYKNFAYLISKVDRNTVANRCGWGITYVNQMAGRHVAIGHRTARKIERGFPDFAPGEHWMDTPQWDQRGGTALAAATAGFTPEEMNVIWSAVEMVKSGRR